MLDNSYQNKERAKVVFCFSEAFEIKGLEFDFASF
jgi:hypothetical protein